MDMRVVRPLGTVKRMPRRVLALLLALSALSGNSALAALTSTVHVDGHCSSFFCMCPPGCTEHGASGNHGMAHASHEGRHEPARVAAPTAGSDAEEAASLHCANEPCAVGALEIATPAPALKGLFQPAVAPEAVTSGSETLRFARDTILGSPAAPGTPPPRA